MTRQGRCADKMNELHTKITRNHPLHKRHHDSLDVMNVDSASDPETVEGVKQPNFELELTRTSTGVLKKSYTAATAHIGDRHGPDENPLVSQLQGTTADVLYSVNLWADKNKHISHKKTHKKTEKEKKVDEANAEFRTKEYMSLRWKIRDICDNPSGRTICLGFLNKVTNYTVICAILGSIILFIVDSFIIESFEGPYCNPDLNPNRTAQIKNGILTCKAQLYSTCGTGCFDTFEIIFSIVFTIEFIVRLAVAESYFSKKLWTGYFDENGQKQLDVNPDRPFFLDFLNYCDFIAIVPIFFDIFETDTTSQGFGFLKLLRVVRVFKIARHFNGSKVMWLTVKESAKGTVVSIFFLVIFIMLVSILMVITDPCIVKPGTKCEFADPINSAYWLVITISTVGYGDQVPQNAFSRAFTMIIMVFAQFYIALPLAIVGAKFEAGYKYVYGSETSSTTISAHQRKQLVLNQTYQLLQHIETAKQAYKLLSNAREKKRPVSEQLQYRKVLHRAMKQIAVTHAAQCTHLDILTPSTILFKKNKRDNGQDLQLAVLKSRFGSTKNMSFSQTPRKSENQNTTEMKHMNTNDDTKNPSEAPGNALLLVNTSHDSLKVNKNKSVSKSLQKHVSAAKKARYIQHVDPDPMRSDQKMQRREAFLATVQNVSCSKRYFNVEYDSVNREQMQMDKMEIDVRCSRVQPINGNEPIMQQLGNKKKGDHVNLKIGDRVLVWAKSQEVAQGIAYELAHELKQHRHLVRLARKGKEAGRCTDNLWLFLEAPEDFSKTKTCGHRFAKTFSVLRGFIVALSVIGAMVQTDTSVNYYGPTTQACQLEAEHWCKNVEWAVENKNGMYGNIAEINWPCYPQTCSNFSETEDLRTPGHMLLCHNGEEVEYPGILSNASSFPFLDSRLRLNITCEVTSYEEYESDPNNTLLIHKSTVRQHDFGEDPFAENKASASLMRDTYFGVAGVCRRQKCVDNSHQRNFAQSADKATVTLAQDMTNEVFGYLEVFFCTWYLVEYLLNLAITRPVSVTDPLGMRRWYKDPATWIEALSMLVCITELVLVSKQANSLQYTVWGMPFVDRFSSTIMRPLRVVVMVRFCLMMREHATMKIFLRTVQETYERVIVPIFFLVVFALIFAGLFYFFMTVNNCVVTAECSDGTTDLYSCPGQDSEDNVNVGTILMYRLEDATATREQGEICMIQNMWDAIWLSFVTISTVGYGVIYPTQSLSKFIAMLAATFGIWYLAMPLSIFGSRYYAIYEEYEKVTSLRQAKAKFQHAMGAVLSLNMNRGTLRQVAQKAARTGDSRVLKRELERWTAQGKSILLPTYVDACKTLARLESEERKAIEEAKAEQDVSAGNEAQERKLTSKENSKPYIEGGLFKRAQVNFLHRYCDYEAPVADDVTPEAFKELVQLHEQFLKIVAEQFLFHDEWDVTSSGPLKRREQHDLRL